MPEIPAFTDLYKAAPIATITVLIVFVGWWARGRSSNKHIETLKEFIEHLKNKND